MGRKVALLCVDPWTEAVSFKPFNYAVRRVQAALLAAQIDGVEIHLVESDRADADELVARIEAIEPDIVAASAYVWSFSTFVDVAERLKRHRDVTVIFGGPSARPAMFDLPPYRDRRFVCDALVLGDGEEVFAQIVALPTLSRQALTSVSGLAIPSRDGWDLTGEPSRVSALDKLASPYEMGLVRSSSSAHVESFRGCPLSCSFCQWGDAAGNSRIFSRDYLARELEAIKGLGLSEALLVDAALNLNLRAFRNLADAERDVGALREIGLHFEVYPSHLTDEHLRFLSDIRLRGVGLGLQSYDKEVLRRMQRTFDDERFDRVARQLRELGGDVTIEIILGLPGDSPETFMRTLDRARSLPCNVRAYQCMVLPDALMTRAPSWADMKFDPATLLMESCAGWTASALRETGERVRRLCEDAQGWTHEAFWFFPEESRRGFTGPEARAKGPDRPVVITTQEAAVSAVVEVLPAAQVARISTVVAAATFSRWTVDAVERCDGIVLLTITTPTGPHVIELASARERTAAYRIVGSVAISYREGASVPSAQFLTTLDHLSVRAAPLFARLLRGSSTGDAVVAPERALVSLPILE